MILNRALRRAVRYFPNNTATIHEGRKQSYRELWERAQALSEALSELGARRGDRVAIYLLNSPQFLEVVYACFKFDLKALMEIVERERVTSTVLVPTMINLLISHPDIGKHDLSSLRRITYGASPMPVELLKRAMKVFPLVDRKKDMIISGGENVYSTEVENVIYQHPAAHEAAVIGVPDEKWGEAVKAIVTLKEGASLTESELIEFCASKLADYKVPKSIEIREGELPKRATGKILKKELREPYWQGRNRRIN